ncbi:MAG TPA: CBS domain-containing protein [Nitrospiria bacterium]|nr:CBS domain-containing protein [Nitrospiria bacterium]
MKRIPVSELMTPNPVTIAHDETVGRAIEVMSRYEIRRLPITRDGKLVGILSDRDLRQLGGRPSLKLPKDDRDDAYLRLPVEEAMTLNVITIRENHTVQDAIALMMKHKISGLPVVDRDAALVGILSEQDVLKFCLSLLERETEQ